MNQINVLIVEDTKTESDALSLVLKENNFNIVGIARTFKEAIHLFYSEDIDIAIIDIFLEEKPDGIAFAEFIDAQPEKLKPFIFLTSTTSREIFNRARLTHPYSYLIKPFNELEIIYAIETAIEKFYDQEDSFSGEDENTIISKDHLFIKKGKSLKKVNIDDIIFIEVEEKYCNIITHKEKFVILISLVKILDLLDEQKFYRTHRNFIVNLQKVQEIIPQDNLILLTGDYKATLSGKYKDIINKFQTLK
ncbi:LytR/AlgR family response regulator transcription factor [Kordia sp.]|uniref:LytR/AlgR family response regulator transcription factor n=1 Tax=Kordia sp. TaxID=1965332 RepID=UPI003B5AA413